MNINFDMVLVINQSYVCWGTEFETTEHLFPLALSFLQYQKIQTQTFWKSWECWTKFSKFKYKNQVFILLHDSQTNNSESLNQEILKNAIS